MLACSPGGPACASRTRRGFAVVCRPHRGERGSLRRPRCGELQPEVSSGRHATVGTNDRASMTAEFIAPVGATALDVYLVTKGPGEAWFSDVGVEDDLGRLLAEGDALVDRGRDATEPPRPALVKRWKTISALDARSPAERQKRVRSGEQLRSTVRALERADELA